MSPIDAARYSWWAIRHPLCLFGLALGATLRDLVLRNDLQKLGFPVSVRDARGLGMADASAGLVFRLHAALESLQPRTVIDVGAEYGRFARGACLAFPDSRTFSFEPLPESYRRLRKAIKGHSCISAFPFALGSADESTVFHRDRNPGSSSLLRMLRSHEQAFPGTGAVSEIVVRVRRLDDMVRAGEVVLTRPVLMKIDVQGFEDRVLEGASETLCLVDAIIIEMSLVPLYEGQVLFAPLRARLEGAGFRYAGEFDQVVSPVTGEACQLDGLFLREARTDPGPGSNQS